MRVGITADGAPRSRHVLRSSKPSPATNRPRPDPLVFHLHGCDDVPGSLVLTEDDYLGFLAGMVGRQDDLLPARIREAVANSSLLFIGYRLADTNFRVLFQGLRPPRGAMTSLVVMVPPDDDSPDKRRQGQGVPGPLLRGDEVERLLGDGSRVLQGALEPLPDDLWALLTGPSSLVQRFNGFCPGGSTSPGSPGGPEHEEHGEVEGAIGPDQQPELHTLPRLGDLFRDGSPCVGARRADGQEI